MKNFICLWVTVACLGFSSCGNNTGEKSTEEHKPNSARNIFEENCAACHGSDGKLCALGAKDLSKSTLDREETIDIIVHGKGSMTPFATLLSKEEIDAVTIYIQTLKK